MNDQLPAIVFIIIGLIVINDFDWPINMIIVIILAVIGVGLIKYFDRRTKSRQQSSLQ